MRGPPCSCDPGWGQLPALQAQLREEFPNSSSLPLRPVRLSTSLPFPEGRDQSGPPSPLLLCYPAWGPSLPSPATQIRSHLQPGSSAPWTLPCAREARDGFWGQGSSTGSSRPSRDS